MKKCKHRLVFSSSVKVGSWRNTNAQKIRETYKCVLCGKTENYILLQNGKKKKEII